MHAPSHTSLTTLPFAEQRNDPHRHPLCGEFVWLQMRFSEIRSVNDILGLCLTGGHIVRVCTCAAWFLWSHGSLAASPLSLWLINQIFILCPEIHGEHRQSSERCVPPSTNALSCLWQKSPNVPLHPSCQFKPSSSFTSSKSWGMQLHTWCSCSVHTAGRHSPQRRERRADARIRQPSEMMLLCVLPLLYPW